MIIYKFPVSGMTEVSARTVLAHPSARQSQSLRRIAWAILKSARGQTVSQTGLNRICRGLQNRHCMSFWPDQHITEDAARAAMEDGE